MSGEKKLTVIGHLEELRARLIKSALAVAVTTVASFFLTGYIFDFLKSRAEGVDLIYTRVPEMLGTYFKVSIYAGLALAMPYLVYHVVMFISPALTRKEKRYLYTLLPAIFSAFIAGIVFGYFVLLPPALRFLLTFGGDIARPLITVGNYVSVITTLLFWLGVCFETPIIIYFLSVIRVVNPRWLARNRRYAVVLAFALGAVITPTFDPVNQTLVALPVYFLFELGVLLSKLAWRGKSY